MHSKEWCLKTVLFFPPLIFRFPCVPLPNKTTKAWCLLKKIKINPYFKMLAFPCTYTTKGVGARGWVQIVSAFL